jgi:lipopolysaccharide assembly protein A
VKSRALLRWIIGIPLLLLMILFALSNTQPVRLGLFPTDLSIEVPLSVAILVALGVGFFCGGLRVWIAALRHRRAAKRAEEKVRVLEARHQEMKARSPVPAALAPPG